MMRGRCSDIGWISRQNPTRTWSRLPWPLGALSCKREPPFLPRCAPRFWRAAVCCRVAEGVLLGTFGTCGGRHIQLNGSFASSRGVSLSLTLLYACVFNGQGFGGVALREGSRVRFSEGLLRHTHPHSQNAPGLPTPNSSTASISFCKISEHNVFGYKPVLSRAPTVTQARKGLRHLIWYRDWIGANPLNSIKLYRLDCYQTSSSHR